MRQRPGCGRSANFQKAAVDIVLNTRKMSVNAVIEDAWPLFTDRRQFECYCHWPIWLSDCHCHHLNSHLPSLPDLEHLHYLPPPPDAIL